MIDSPGDRFIAACERDAPVGQGEETTPFLMSYPVDPEWFHPEAGDYGRVPSGIRTAAWTRFGPRARYRIPYDVERGHPMKLSLVVLTEGKQSGKVLNITLAQFLIGRDPQCHLRPSSQMISKRHCALIQRDGKAFIRDFDSTNGTLVNEQPVKGEVELHHDDQLKVGPLLFSVRLEASAPVNRPTPAPPTKSSGSLSAAKDSPAKAPSPVASPTPPPKTEAATAGGGAEEDIAALLLSLDGDSPGGSAPASGEVPEGSTVMDVAVPPKEPDGSAASSSSKIQAGKEKKKPDGNTASAAKSILEKYMRRPRS